MGALDVSAKMKYAIILTTNLSLISSTVGGATIFRGEDPGVDFGDSIPNSLVAEAQFLDVVQNEITLTFDGGSVSSTNPLSATPLDLGVDLNILGGSSSAMGEVFPFRGDGYESFPVSGDALALSEFGAGEPRVDYSFKFGSNITALGFFLSGGRDTTGGEIEILFDDGVSQTLDLSTPEIDSLGGVQYLGLVFDQPVSEVVLSLVPEGIGGESNSLGVSVDNLSFSFVPEPSTQVLISIFSAAFLVKRRR